MALVTIEGISNAQKITISPKIGYSSINFGVVSSGLNLSSNSKGIGAGIEVYSSSDDNDIFKIMGEADFSSIKYPYGPNPIDLNSVKLSANAIFEPNLFEIKPIFGAGFVVARNIANIINSFDSIGYQLITGINFNDYSVKCKYININYPTTDTFYNYLHNINGFVIESSSNFNFSFDSGNDNKQASKEKQHFIEFAHDSQ